MSFHVLKIIKKLFGNKNPHSFSEGIFDFLVVKFKSIQSFDALFDELV